MIKQFTPFTVNNLNVEDLEDKILTNKLSDMPMTAHQTSRNGWVFVEGEEYFVQQGNFYVLKARLEDKIIPSAAVKHRLREEIESRVEKPNKQEIREIKEAIIADMSANALIKSADFHIIIDVERSRIYSLASGNKVAVVNHLLRETLGGLEANALLTFTSSSRLTEIMHNSHPNLSDENLVGTLTAEHPDGERKIKYTNVDNYNDLINNNYRIQKADILISDYSFELSIKSPSITKIKIDDIDSDLEKLSGVEEILSSIPFIVDICKHVETII